MSEPQPSEYGLVMPFVVCGEDGPYDAASFVAGWVCGNLDDTLRNLDSLQQDALSAATVKRYVHPAVVPQLDLIAMRYGFKLATEPWGEHPDEWVLATFTKGDSDNREGT